MYSAEVNWLVPGFLALGELTMLVAAPEACKSWLAADLARAVFTGGSWLGQFAVPEGRVLFVEQERGANLVYQLTHLERAYDVNLDGLLVLPPSGFRLSDPTDRARLQALVAEHQPTLIVINSFRACFRGRAADGADIAEALGWLGILAERSRCTVLMIDAVNKLGGLGRVRGMASHADSLQKAFEADCVLHVERSRDPLGRGVGPGRLFVGKRRHGEAGAPFRFELLPVGGGVTPLWQAEIGVEQPAPASETADDRVRLALLAAIEPQAPEALAARTGLVVGTVKNALSRLKRQGQIEQAGRGLWRSAAVLAAEAENDHRNSAENDDYDDEPPQPAQLPGDQIWWAGLDGAGGS
jgi:hypothetical protein